MLTDATQQRTDLRKLLFEELGVHVASMQLRVLLEEMLRRFTRVELTEEPRRTVSNFSAGYDAVMVRIPPRAR